MIKDESRVGRMEFETLIAKRAVGRATAKDYASWAEKLLSDGTDSIKQHPDTEEVEHYFKACAEELGDQYVIKVAHQFIKLNALDLPDSFFSLSACSQCGFIGEVTMQRDEKTWLPESIFRVIYGFLPAPKPICKQCGVPYPKGMSDYTGRELYINSVME